MSNACYVIVRLEITSTNIHTGFNYEERISKNLPNTDNGSDENGQTID